MNADGERGGKRRQTNEQSVEARLKQSTIGLVHLSDFRRIKSELEEHRQRTAAQTLITDNLQDEPAVQPRRKKAKRQKKAQKLSFDSDTEPDDSVVAGGVGKNPA
ncbi:hypothetical protein LPJ73_002446, partial [Coemansia sp. RSA 2703]